MTRLPARRFESIGQSLEIKAARAAARHRPPSYGGTVGTYHPGRGYGARWGGARDLLSEIGPIDHNPIVRLCLHWYGNAITEAFFRVGKRVARGPKRGEFQSDDTHRLYRILNQFNPTMAYREVMERAIADFLIDGNVYFVIVRDNGGEPMELWWVPTWQVQVNASGNPVRPVDHYRVSGLHGHYIDYDPEEIVHVRDLIDARNPVVGIGILKSFLEYLAALQHGGAYTDRALRRGNAGIAIMPPKDGGQMGYHRGSPEEMEMLAHKERLDRGLSRDDGTAVIALTTYLEHAKIGFSPEEMTLDRILDRPESYICSAMGQSALLHDLPSSSATRTFANKGEARRAVWEDSLVPMLGIFSEAFTRQVLYRTDPDSGNDESQFRGDGQGMEVWADTSGVPALQEDRTEKARHLLELLADRVVTREYVASQLDIPPEAVPEDEPEQDDEDEGEIDPDENSENEDEGDDS